jgi:prepilin-type N-terminal cleavage/methylation domain-containing protein
MTPTRSKSFKRPPGKHRNSGFTLTELLVVIVIVAVLATLTFTLVSRARESARQVGCLSNLKNIAGAVMLYASDNGDNLPFEVTSPPDNPGTHSSIWQQDLGAYVQYPKANTGESGGERKSLPGSCWHCPSANKKRSWSGTEPDYAAMIRYSNAPGSPGVFSRNGWGTNVPALKRAAISEPSRCMMVFDSCDGTSVLNGSWSSPANKANLGEISAGVPKSRVAPRHGYNGKDSRTGRFGVVYCDGHAEAFQYGDPRLRDPNFVKASTVPF